MKTPFLKPSDVNREWHVIDAEGKILGRIAAKAASYLRGKHRPSFTPNLETGDYIIIINAEKAMVTGGKELKKIYYRHSGYPGGLSGESYQKVVNRKPTYPLEKAIKGMLPKGPLGRKLFRNVKIYAGPEHPHAAQQPKPLEL